MHEHLRNGMCGVAGFYAGADSRWHSQNGNMRSRLSLWHYLEACPWNLRHWETNYLLCLFTADGRSLQGAHRWVHVVAFSTDGKRMRQRRQGMTLKVWDADKGTRTPSPQGATRGWSCEFCIFKARWQTHRQEAASTRR